MIFRLAKTYRQRRKKRTQRKSRILKLLRKAKVKFIVRRTAHQANTIIHRAVIIIQVSIITHQAVIIQASIITPHTITPTARIIHILQIIILHTTVITRKKMSIPAKIGISALAIILAVILAFVGTFAFLESRGKNELKNVPDQTNYQETIEYNGNKYVYNSDVIAIAFMGVDKRDLGLDNGSVGTGGQSDADILLTINTKTGKAKAIAIPRDTMVDVDLYSESGIFLRSEKMQLCLSYAYGDGKAKSAENTANSISRILYDVPITKYFALDLNGIAPINDSIGGVTVDSLYDFNDIGIKKGDKIKLKGDMTENM